MQKFKLGIGIDMKLITFNLQERKSLITILLSILVLLSGCNETTSKSEDSNFDAYLQQAQSYLEIHQFKPAYNAVNEAIKAQPTKIDGYLMLAKINEGLGRSQQNIAMLKAFKGKTNSEYYFTLLNAYQQSGKIISSQKLIDEQLKTLQEQPQRLQFAQAKQLLYKQQWQQAKSAFKALLENPDYKIESMLALARIEAATDNINSAVAIIDKILELNPQHIDTLFLKSNIYIKQGDLSNAEKNLTQALSYLPTTDIFTTQRTQIIKSLANILTQQGHSAEAMIYTRILAEEFPSIEPITNQYTRAVKLFENQQFSEAKTLLLEIHDKAPQYKKAATLLGLIFYKEGDPKNAEKYLADIVDPEVSPLKLTELYIATQLQQNKSANVLALLEYIPEANRNTDTWVLYGNAAIQQKKFAAAEMAINKARALTPKSIKVTLLENYYYNNLPEPQPELALRSLANALADNAENPILQNLYIRQLIRLSKETEADNYVTYLQKSYSNNNRTQLLVANYYIYQQKIEVARKIVEKVLGLEENNLQALYSLAKINAFVKDWEASLASNKTIISFYPEEVTAYKAIIVSLLKMDKDPLTAAEYLPKNYQASVLALTLADLTQQQNKLDLATKYASEASNELPSKYQANLEELTLQINLKKAFNAYIDKDYLKARQIVMPALQESPQDTRLLSLLVHIEIASKQYTEAQKITEQIQTLLPNNSLATLLNGEIFIARGEQQRAINLLNSYWKQSKDEKVAQQLYLQFQRLNSDKAVSFLDEWQTALPASLIGNRYKAIYLQNKGDYQQALQIYEKILKQHGNDVISLNNAAWLYSKQNNIKRATSLAKQAYQLQPNNGAIADTYGWILFTYGDKNQGRALIEQAIELMPDDPSIKEHFTIVNKT